MSPSIGDFREALWFDELERDWPCIRGCYYSVNLKRCRHCNRTIEDIRRHDEIKHEKLRS